MTEKTVDELVSEAVAEAVAEVTAQFQDKEKELNRENAKWRRLAQQKDVIDPSEVENLQTKIDELQSQLSASGKTQKEQAKLLKQTQDALASESGFTQRLLLDNGLTDALVKAGVATPMLHAVKAMLGSQAKVIVDGDARKAVIGDKDLTEFVTSWATTDEGKHFIAAPANGGGGASGGAGNGSNAKVWTREKFDASSHYERSEFAKSGGKVVD
jgi:hypothetical protein